MKTTFLILAAFSVLSLSSCGSDKSGEKGTTIQSTKTAVAALLADTKGNEGKRFAITGYLHYATGMSVYVNRPQTVYVCPEPGKVGDAIASIKMPWKQNGVNSVFVPEDASGDDSKTVFYDNGGKPLSMNDKVTVSFSVSDPNDYLVEIRIDKEL